MTHIDLAEYSKLTRLEKARVLASIGDFNTVKSMAREGVLNALSEADQRQILATAYNEAAAIREGLVAQGLYPEAEWHDPNLQEAGANFSITLRAKALDILLNPDGKNIQEQFL